MPFRFLAKRCPRIDFIGQRYSIDQLSFGFGTGARLAGMFREEERGLWT